MHLNQYGKNWVKLLQVYDCGISEEYGIELRKPYQCSFLTTLLAYQREYHIKFPPFLGTVFDVQLILKQGI